VSENLSKLFYSKQFVLFAIHNSIFEKARSNQTTFCMTYPHESGGLPSLIFFSVSFHGRIPACSVSFNQQSFSRGILYHLIEN
jgi:hypothetical protein